MSERLRLHRKKLGWAPAAHHRVRAHQCLPVGQHQAEFEELGCGHVRSPSVTVGACEDHPMQPGDILGAQLELASWWSNGWN